jgi:hypothetical protein
MIYTATYYQIIINIQKYKNKIGVTKAEILHYSEPFIFYELDKIEYNSYIQLIQGTLDEINKYITEGYLIKKNKKIFINYENPTYKSFIESYNSTKSKCNKNLNVLLEFINFDDDTIEDEEEFINLDDGSIEEESYSKKIQDSKSKITESLSRIKKPVLENSGNTCQNKNSSESVSEIVNEDETSFSELENDELCYDYYIFNSLTDKNEFYLINDNLTHCGCKAFEYKGNCKHLTAIKKSNIEDYDKINLNTKICSCKEFHENNNCIHSTFEYDIV